MAKGMEPAADGGKHAKGVSQPQMPVGHLRKGRGQGRWRLVVLDPTAADKFESASRD